MTRNSLFGYFSSLQVTRKYNTIFLIPGIKDTGVRCKIQDVRSKIFAYAVRKVVVHSLDT